MPSDPLGRELQRDQLLMVARSSSRSFVSMCIANCGVALVASHWTPAPLVLGWLAVMAATMGLSHWSNLRYLQASPDLAKFPRLAVMYLSISGATMLAFSAGAVIFWAPGEPINHLFVLILMVTSAAVGTVYTAPYAPLSALQSMYLATAVGLCLWEGTLEYAMIGGMGFVVLAMLAGVGFSINDGGRQILTLRYSERALIAKLRDASQAKS